MKRTVKAKDHEKLTTANIQKVIGLLFPETGKPITKKEACEILNISYNTSRLDKIIEEFRERVAYTDKRKELNRGKPASIGEIQQIITEYLQGEPVANIAKRLYRAAGFVNKIIESVGVPSRSNTDGLLPDSCIAEDFSYGERVWSAVYNKPAIVKEELTQEYVAKMKGMSNTDYVSKYATKCYAIYVIEPADSEDSLFPGVRSGGFFAYSPSYNLGKLKHLEAYGVDLSKI